MFLSRLFCVIVVLSAVVSLTGCVGPMAHGRMGGCCGPASATNNSACSGCGELYIDPWINEPADCVDPCDQCGNYNGQSCGKCRSVFAGIRSLWGYRCGDECTDCVGPVCFSGGCGALNGGGGCGCGSTCGAEVSCGCEQEVSCGCRQEVSCGCEPDVPCDCRQEASCGCEPSCGLESIGDGQIIYGDNSHGVIDGGGYSVEGPQMPTRGAAVQPANEPYKPERARKIFNPRPRVATGDGREIGY